MPTASRRPIIDIFLLLFFALYFYRLGVTSLEAFFNYPFWKDMGPMMSNADFVELRSLHTSKIFILLVGPAALLTMVTLALTLVGAAGLPRWAFLGVLAMQVIEWISTFMVQLPIQMQLDSTGFDPAALDRLITTDLFFRKLPALVEGMLVATILWAVIRAPSRTHNI